MTLHVVLPTADHKGLAWISDTIAVFGLGNTSDVKKVRYFEEHKFAYSSWGDFATAYIADNFAERVRAGSVELSNPEMVISSLKASAEETLGQLTPQGRQKRAEQQGGHGIILVAFRQPMRLFEAHIGAHPIVREATGSILGGDLYNPARIFPQYYYPLSNRSLIECIRIGVHTMRLAKHANSMGIGDPVVWVYEDGCFRNLPEQEVQSYVRASELLDNQIVGEFRKEP